MLLELGDEVVDDVDVDESIVEPLGAAWVDGALSVDDESVCEPVVGETPGLVGAVPVGGLLVCGPPVLFVAELLESVLVPLWPMATPAAANDATMPTVAARFNSLLMSMLQLSG